MTSAAYSRAGKGVFRKRYFGMLVPKNSAGRKKNKTVEGQSRYYK
jgi:hypothetical protein